MGRPPSKEDQRGEKSRRYRVTFLSDFSVAAALLAALGRSPRAESVPHDEHGAPGRTEPPPTSTLFELAVRPPDAALRASYAGLIRGHPANMSAQSRRRLATKIHMRPGRTPRGQTALQRGPTW